MENTPKIEQRISQEAGKQDWVVPELLVISVNGDPTISDDGLGDGLFS